MMIKPSPDVEGKSIRSLDSKEIRRVRQEIRFLNDDTQTITFFAPDQWKGI
jgi:hypothetical protein